GMGRPTSTNGVKGIENHAPKLPFVMSMLVRYIRQPRAPAAIGFGRLSKRCPIVSRPSEGVTKCLMCFNDALEHRGIARLLVVGVIEPYENSERLRNDERIG